jgi:single-strand DNA-binding protein
MLIGHLGRDAEIREFGNRSVISFNVAHSERYMDRELNTMRERTTWVRCSYWRDPDKVGVAQYLKKGTQVFVEGMISAQAYTDKDGQMQASLDLRVDRLELLGSSGGTGGGAQQSGVQAQPQATATAPRPTAASQAPPIPTAYPEPGGDPDDDLPF